MKPIPFKMKGTEYALTVKIATYPEGNLAIKLYTCFCMDLLEIICRAYTDLITAEQFYIVVACRPMKPIAVPISSRFCANTTFYNFSTTFASNQTAQEDILWNPKS